MIFYNFPLLFYRVHLKITGFYAGQAEKNIFDYPTGDKPEKKEITSI